LRQASFVDRKLGRFFFASKLILNQIVKIGCSSSRRPNAGRHFGFRAGGGTDVRKRLCPDFAILNTSGSDDTVGYVVTGSVGHIFALTDRVRFDLRGSMLGVSFTGDDYTDSGGNQFGESHISFGAFKFEPGIYGDFQLENGMTFSPYARADFQPRFAYRNTASIDGREIDFDDSDFSVALSTGFNLKMSEMATMSGEVRGKVSSDSSTLGGKLGLKIAF
jgi:outer membrane autotransporter protein